MILEIPEGVKNINVKSTKVETLYLSLGSC